MRRSPARLGFTLLEVLIASTLFAAVGAAISTIFISTERVAQQTASIQQAQSQARTAMILLEREVRAGSGSSLVSSDIANDILTFATLPPNTVTPVVVSYFVDLDGNLVRQQGAVQRILASNVSAFGLSAATADSVTVGLEITVHEQSATLSTTVGFRNP